MDEAATKRAIEELRAYVDRWYALFPVGNAKAMGELYTEDARRFLADLPGVTGAAGIGAFLGSIPTYVDIITRHSVNDIQVLSQSIAVITGSAWVETRVKADGAQNHDASRFVMVMSRKDSDDAWRCAYDVSQHTPDIK